MEILEKNSVKPEKILMCHSQSPETYLATAAARMKESRLRCAGIKLADLNLILGELAREGRIRL